MNKLKNLVKMSADKYNEMAQNGSVDIGGTLVSFEVGNLCLVPEEPIVIDTTLSNAGQAADAAAVGEALERYYEKVDGVKFASNSNDGTITINPTSLVLSTGDQKLATWYENGSIELYIDGIGFVELALPTEAGTILTDASGYKKVDDIILGADIDNDGYIAVGKTGEEGEFLEDGVYIGNGMVSCNYLVDCCTLDGTYALQLTTQGILEYDESKENMVGMYTFPDEGGGTIATQEYVQENAGGKLYEHHIYACYDDGTGAGVYFYIRLYNNRTTEYTKAEFESYCSRRNTVVVLHTDICETVSSNAEMKIYWDENEGALVGYNGVLPWNDEFSSFSDTVTEM